MKFFLFYFLFIFNSYSSTLEINKEHSSLKFTVDYMTMIKVEGQFKSFSGIFNFDPNSKLLQKIKVKINSSSIDTNESKRDFHLKNMDFLFISKYPEMEFLTTEDFYLALNEKKTIFGDLIIRGIKKKVTGKINYKGCVKDPWGKESYFFEFKLEIDRKDFKLNWNKELDQGGYLVGDIIYTKIIIQAQKEGEKTAFSTHMIPARALLKKSKIKLIQKMDSLKK